MRDAFVERRVRQLAADVEELRAEVVQLVRRRVDDLRGRAYSLEDDPAELVCAVRLLADAEDSERDARAVGTHQSEERRSELSAREVAGGAKDDHDARVFVGPEGADGLEAAHGLTSGTVGREPPRAARAATTPAPR